MSNPGTIPQGFPQDQQIVFPETGLLTPAWKYFLLTIWNALGIGDAPVTASAIMSYSGSLLYAKKVGASSSSLVPFTIAPADPIVITVGPSPDTYTAPNSGVYTACGGTLELKRNSAAYIQVNLADSGGQLVLHKGDRVRITYASDPSPVTFFPGGMNEP